MLFKATRQGAKADSWGTPKFRGQGNKEKSCKWGRKRTKNSVDLEANWKKKASQEGKKWSTVP